MAFKAGLSAPEFALLNTPSRATTSIANQLTRAVNEAVAAKKSTDDVEELLWRLWNAIISTASRTPAAEQGQLVFLLQDIAAQGELKTADGGQVVTVWDKKVWSDLPVFGAAVREVFNSDELTDDEEQTQWVNVNAFLARLTAEGAESNPGGPLDYSLFGIWSLRDALEGEESAATPAYKKNTAQAWIDNAGPTLKKLSEQQKQFDGKMAAPGSAHSSKDWRGYNNERWAIWNAQLQKA